MLAKLASKVEGVVIWGVGIDWKVDEVATFTMEMGMFEHDAISATLAKKFSVL
jgi:hypothetical protein